MMVPSPARLILIVLLTFGAAACVALVCNECSASARHFLRELFRFVL